MIKQVSVLLFASLMYGQENARVIKSLYPAVQTDHPVWFQQWFKKGEIPDFPKTFAQPSTGSRAAASKWQATIRSKWKDKASNKSITGGQVGDTILTTGVGGIVSIQNVSATNIATITTTDPHGWQPGYRLWITVGSGVDADLNRDNFILMTASGNTATFMTRNVSNATYTTNITVRQTLDPLATTYVRLKSVNHDLLRGEYVVCTGIGGLIGATGAFTVLGTSRDEFMINSPYGSGTYTSGGTCVGLGPGSVREAYIAAKVTIPAYPGTTKLDFVNDANPSSAGDVAATIAAGMDKTEMLAATWNAQLVATFNVQAGNTPTYTTDFRSMLTAWDGVQSECNTHYEAIGPVMTVATVQVGCKANYLNDTDYDFGAQMLAGPTLAAAVTSNSQTTFTVVSSTGYPAGTRLWAFAGSQAELSEVTGVAGNVLTVTRGKVGGIDVPNSAKFTSIANGYQFGTLNYVNAPNDFYRGIHPIARLRYLDGWAGVGVRVRVRNESVTKMQTMYYAAEIKLGSTPTTAWSVPEFKHTNRSSWSANLYDGDNAEFYCSNADGSVNAANPDACNGGGKFRRRRFIIDQNFSYEMASKQLPQWEQFSGTDTREWNVSTFYPGKGFAASDKGAVGVTRVSSGENHPGLFLGGGTWGAKNSSYTTADASTDNQEGGVLEVVQALHQHNFDEDGYEINYGDTVAGGGGNVEAQGHLPIHDRESDLVFTRFFMPGYDTPAFGNEISVWARPTYKSASNQLGGSNVHTNDRPWTACITSGVITSSTPNKFPCTHTGQVHGDDNYSILAAHLNNWHWWAYQTSGEQDYLDMIGTWASQDITWHWRNSAGQKSWAHTTTSSTSTLIREQTWTHREAIRGFLESPNVPMYGASQVSAKPAYYNNVIWDEVYAMEGFMGITDGWFAQHYPTAFPYTCPGGTYPVNDVNIWMWARCGTVEGASNMANALGWPAGTTYPWDSDYPYIGPPPQARGMDIWMMGYFIPQWHLFEDQGFPHWRYARNRLEKTMLLLTGHKDINRHLAITAYQNPADPPGSLIQTALAWWAGFNPNGWLNGAATHFKTYETFNYFPGGDGTQPDGYPAQAYGWSAFPGSAADEPGCTPADRPPSGCTNVDLHEWLKKNKPGQDSFKLNPKFAFDYRHEIKGLAIVPGSTSAIATYTAPNSKPCFYYVGTSAPTSSLLTGYTSDGGGQTKRRVLMTLLTAATAYKSNWVCGVDTVVSPGGTVGLLMDFTTTATGIASTYVMKLHSIPGSTTITIEYGPTSGLGSSVGPTTCTAGCSMSVPSVKNETLYYRIVYKNGGTTISQSPIRSTVPKL